jgi:hypothetical protein
MADAPPPLAPAAVQVDNAQNVNVPGPAPTQLPYVSIIAIISLSILAGFAFVTWWVISSTAEDPTLVVLKGSLIQTWNNLAVTAAGFWLASSLGGKLASAGSGAAPNTTGRTDP